MARQSGSDPGLFDRSFRYGQLPSLTGFLLRRASLLDFSTFPDTIGDRSITPLRYSVLEVVGENPGLQQVQLAAILGLTKPAATLAINFWEARNCLTRRKTASDGRVRGVHLTGSGEEVLAELRQDVARHDTELTECLSEVELANLHNTLRKIIEGETSKARATSSGERDLAK